MYIFYRHCDALSWMCPRWLDSLGAILCTAPLGARHALLFWLTAATAALTEPSVLDLGECIACTESGSLLRRLVCACCYFEVRDAPAAEHSTITLHRPSSCVKTVFACLADQEGRMCASYMVLACCSHMAHQFVQAACDLTLHDARTSANTHAHARLHPACVSMTLIHTSQRVAHYAQKHSLGWAALILI